jgi:Protein of unknown function (DUF3300)
MRIAVRSSSWLAGLAFTLAALDVPVRAEGSISTSRSAAQLDQLVAPIALYPDPLLAQVLMAATYPLEVAESARWSQANLGVAGEALEDSMQKEVWDPSVKGLTAVPQVLQMMNDKLDWTHALGDAFLAAQPALLDAVQRLRARANVAGNLQTTAQQKVSRVAAPPEPGSSAAPATVYMIEPAVADEYSVPIYDSSAVYGTWPHPEHQPFRWYPLGFVAESGILVFASGVAVGGAIWGRVDWWNHRVNINVSRFNRFNHTKISRNAWVHDPAHRGGVPYRDSAVAARFGDRAKAVGGEGSSDLDAVRRDLAEPPKADDAKPKKPRASVSARTPRHVRGPKAGGQRRPKR